MLPDRPRLQVLVDDRDLTDRCDGLTFSATDNGGYEIATLGMPAASRPRKGASITIRQGLEVAWQGRVAEISDHSQHGRATQTTGCEGLRALLRDTLYSMIYVDRDLSQWGSPSTGRQIALNAANLSLAASQVAPSPLTGVPSITQTISDTFVSPYKPDAETWYDAGPGNLVAAIWYTISPRPTVDANWNDLAFFATDDVATGTQATANLANDLGASNYFAPVARRFVVLQHLYTATPSGVAGGQFSVYWGPIAVYGTHGLVGRGPNPAGVYPSDVARHALSQSSGIVPGAITDAIGYVIPHLVYRTPTPADQIIDDMAKLMGWTWGVWEPSTILGSQPRLDFRPPPTDATCVVTKAECDQLDITSRLGDLYDVCQVTYTDEAGSQGLATVTLPNPQLSEAGIATRTLPLSMGQASQAAATAFASYALALSQVAARAAGQATLPNTVRLIGGGSKPAVLVRPGLDRLRIVDFSNSGSLLDTGTARRDVFRISRVETTVGSDGVPATRVELDSGSNLMETLQARLSIAAGVVGSGASGG